jgi:hypothetical protein
MEIHSSKFLKKILTYNKNGLLEVLAAWLPAEVAFLLIPFALYIPNQAEFDYNIAVLLPYIILAVASLAILTLLFLFKPSLLTKIFVGLFCLGVYLALSDTLAPVQKLEIGNRMIDPIPARRLDLSLLDLGIAALCLYGALKLSITFTRRLGTIITLTLLLTGIPLVINRISTKTHINAPRINVHPVPELLSKNGNIYHITFDAFSNYEFLELLKQTESLRNFPGFVFFKENRSNYFFTFTSAANFTMGTFYRQGSIEEWLNKRNSLGIINNLFKEGYEVSQYIPNQSWTHQKASHITLAGQVYQRRFITELRFADIWLLRLAPHILHQRLYDRRNSKGLVSIFISKWIPSTELEVLPFEGLSLMRKLILDEELRSKHGQYVYAHIYIPHFPYRLTNNCTYLLKAGYTSQACCAINLMKELLAELKRQGKYNDSLIIFQSDHGSGEIGSKDWSDCNMSFETSEKIAKVDLAHRKANVIANISRSLLLIKPFHSSHGPLVVSERLTQLADIPATVYSSISSNYYFTEAISVFDNDFPEDRTIHIFSGFDQLDKNGLLLRFGTNIFKGEMNHYSYSKKNGWQVLDNIKVEW